MDEDKADPQTQIQQLKYRIADLESQLAEHHPVITGRAVQMSDDKYRILIENANDAVLVAQDNAFAFFNRRTEELTGFGYEALTKMPFIDLVHPEDRKLVGSRYLRRLAGEDVEDVYTFRALKKDGTYFWVEIRAVLISWQTHPAVLCFLTDITERKSTEMSLGESEQRYRNIVELSPYGIVTLDTKGVIVSVNKAFIELTGYGHDDFVGRHISRIPTIHLSDVPRFVRLFAQLIRHGFDKQVVFGWTHRDGSERWGEARGVLLTIEGKVYGLQGIIRDVTEQRRATLLLEALNRTALAVAQVTKPQEIFTVMGKELRQLGIACAILLSREQGKHLVPAYISYSSRAIRLVERLVKKKTENFIIDVARVDVFKQAVWERKTVLASDPLTGAQQMLPDFLKSVAAQLIRILEIKTSINTPLIIEDQVIGLLSVQSDVFRKVDVPTITAFANMMAAALHKAQLLEQAQLELEERRRAESEINRLQRLLQNITDSMPSALITLDINGQVLTANPTASTLLTGRVLIEPGIVLWQIDPAFELYRDLFDEVIKTKETVNRHQEQLTIQDSVVYQNIDAFPLVVDSLQGVVLRIDNVTEFVRLQEMMLQSAKLASVGGLAAGVAHEINNPLAAMIQSAQMIQQTLDVDNLKTVERMKNAGVNPEALVGYLADRHLFEYVEGIREAGGRAAKIVTDLLAFSRKRPAAKSPVVLNNIIETALDLAAKDYNLMQHFDFRDIEIVRHLDQDLPLVVCDQQQIQQVVLNLLINAAQALVKEYDKRSVFKPRITISSVKTSCSVQMMIEDNGSGIDQAAMDHLFEPFFTTKQVGEGTGLGLWLSWSIIVELHQGKIWAEPMPESGVRFVVELPLGAEDQK